MNSTGRRPPYPLENRAPLAKHFRDITLDSRFGNAEGGHFSDVNLTSVLFKARSDASEHVKMEVWHAPGRSKPFFKEAIRKHYKPLRKGEQFGPSWTNHWVRIHLTVPKEWQNEERVQLEFDPGCEAMVFDTEGRPLQGITGGSVNERRVEFILKERRYSQTFYIEVSANGMFGTGDDDMTGPNEHRYFTLASADIVVPRMEAWHLLWDFRIIKDLARNLPAESRLGAKALYVGNEMLNVFKHNDLSSIGKARKVAEQILGEGWQKLGEKVFESEPGSKGDVPIWAMSNCHIDTAWLWPFRVTQQKTARSWSTQCDLMDRYPEHRFVASQAQQFKWLEQQYPQLFDVIKGKVDAGQFMPIGGSWVENDTNLPSGESLCRQMIFGQRYFKSRFGKYCDVHWLPDTFGYSSQLPQICRAAGMPSFFTQKLSWSQFNNFPHTTFNWIGLNGTQVLTHMTPVNTYNAGATVQDAINGVKNHKNLEVTDISLLPFGNGDGGGGAVPPMLENLRRLRSVANHHSDLPKIGYGAGRSISEMYQAILKQTDNGKKLPTWIGELYLEFHRGTYTSHGSIKRHNRKSEVLLQELEYLATLASVQASSSKSGYKYPKAEIDPLWEQVLLCQFHDVLPGSALEMVYEDVEEIYADVYEKANELLEAAIKELIPDSLASFGTSHGKPFALNPTGLPRQEIVNVGEAVLARDAVFQKADAGGLVLMEDLEGSGVARISGSDVEPATCKVSDGVYTLSNESLQVKVGANGRITSIVDLREDRELISRDRSAGFVIYEDIPGRFDAWDVDVWHLETAEHLEASSVKSGLPGPLRASVVSEYKVGKSTWKTTISLDAVATTGDALSMIRINTEADWHEQHRFLKWEIPVEIFSAEAFYETQFGYLARPTHRNTTWDAAKFEVCGHKYIDLSEYGYGLAMLNESKYGFAVEGNVMRISLLRGATGPDLHQDQGEHAFSFALLPHKEHFHQTDVPKLAKVFNAPLKVKFASASAVHQLASDVRGPFAVEGAPNVIIDTVKRGDDDDFLSAHASKSVICRLFESKGGHARAKLATSLPVAKASIVDLLERTMEELELVSGSDGKYSVKLPFKGFQFITVKLDLADDKRDGQDSWNEVSSADL